MTHFTRDATLGFKDLDWARRQAERSTT